MVLLQISASVAEDSAAMGNTIHVTSRLMQLPVKQRNFGLTIEETGEVSRRPGSRSTGSGSGKFGTVTLIM
jgi:hypothetical protein